MTTSHSASAPAAASQMHAKANAPHPRFGDLRLVLLDNPGFGNLAAALRAAPREFRFQGLPDFCRNRTVGFGTVAAPRLAARWSGVGFGKAGERMAPPVA